MSSGVKKKLRFFRLLTNILCLPAVVRGFEINKENQFIDFRLITRSGKNRAFIPLRQQPQKATLFRSSLERFVRLEDLEQHS